MVRHRSEVFLEIIIGAHTIIGYEEMFTEIRRWEYLPFIKLFCLIKLDEIAVYLMARV